MIADFGAVCGLVAAGILLAFPTALCVSFRATSNDSYLSDFGLQVAVRIVDYGRLLCVQDEETGTGGMNAEEAEAAEQVEKSIERWTRSTTTFDVRRNETLAFV